jgi:hypothetical protein
LVIMGSGETTTGMLGVHRAVFGSLPEDADCRLMDSPFAFQENADELVAKINQYFTESLGHPLRRVSLPASADALTVETALADIRSADWLFAGPGSPSYARRCWEGTAVPDALAGVLEPGRSGALVIASAAAVTLGRWALPVYEIYKVGEDPRWEPGLDLMSRLLGWTCAVVPHYDNREGGTHDTRYCYLGGRRLGQIEGHLSGGFLLGVDEHTALVLDLDARTASVSGRGGATLRVAGVEDVLPAGTSLTIAELQRRVEALGAPGAVGSAREGRADASESVAGTSPQNPATGDQNDPAPGDQGDPAPRNPGDPAAGAAPDQATDADPAAPDPEALASAILAALPDTAARERAAVVTLLRRADDAASQADRELAGRAVQALVDVRAASRAAGDWAASDSLRDALAGLGVEVRDSREGSTWVWA